MGGKKELDNYKWLLAAVRMEWIGLFHSALIVLHRQTKLPMYMTETVSKWHPMKNKEKLHEILLRLKAKRPSTILDAIKET